jgi:hypothetical protein
MIKKYRTSKKALNFEQRSIKPGKGRKLHWIHLSLDRGGIANNGSEDKSLQAQAATESQALSAQRRDEGVSQAAHLSIRASIEICQRSIGSLTYRTI